MLDFAVWVVVGIALGWFSSAISGQNSGPGKALNLLTGVVGAYLAGVIVTPLFTGTQEAGPISLLAVGCALAGAVLLLAVVNGPRRGRVR